MIKLSKKVEYALIAIYHLAENSEMQPVSAREIMEIYNLPQELLGKILQKLVKANLIESLQGPKGGYVLKKSLREITLKDIIDIIDGSIRLTQCSTRLTPFCSCKQLKTCNIKNAIYHLQKEIISYFDSINLEMFFHKEMV